MVRNICLTLAFVCFWLAFHLFREWVKTIDDRVEKLEKDRENDSKNGHQD